MREDIRERYILEEKEGWRSLMDKIPYIPFKETWEVQVVPPFAGAVARFIVRRKGKEKTRVSVYLDWFENLGYFSGPYWEIYPLDGDTGRYELNDITGLVQAIELSLQDQEKTR